MSHKLINLLIELSLKIELPNLKRLICFPAFILFEMTKPVKIDLKVDF